MTSKRTRRGTAPCSSSLVAGRYTDRGPEHDIAAADPPCRTRHLPLLCSGTITSRRGTMTTATTEDGPGDLGALSALQAVPSPLALHAHRASGTLVGRPAEITALEQELAAASQRLVGATLEGEPGIGKTRLLLAAGEMATARGFTTIGVTADEEIRGPFLVARSIVGAHEAVEAVRDTPAEPALGRAMDALTGRADPSLASLPPDAKLLRTLDLGAVAIRDLAATNPAAILVDDLQWADDDSLRLLRYIVRADAASPILLLFAIRPEEFAFATEAVHLVADMERVGLIRRLRLHRFGQPETKAMLQQLLGGTVNATSAAAMHAQSEGVPFIVEEMAHAYRDQGMIQQIDGVWTLSGNAERLVPSAVRTLISRRAAHLPDDTKEALAIAAVLGRHFSLKDLVEIEQRAEQRQTTSEELASMLAPAVAAGLLVAHDAGSAADYSFPHDQIREFATAGLSAPRRQAIHAAIVELLMVGEPSVSSLPLIAQHARAAGNADVCVRYSLEASRMALEANAPEEVLRVVEVALPSAAGPTERVKLLEARDRALEMLRRPADRLQGLAELSALAEALGDKDLELDLRLRRAAAYRMQEEFDLAAQLARGVREGAASEGDRQRELAACIELGQVLLRSPLGEGYSPTPIESDFDAADEAYRRAAELARELGDEESLAAVLRECGVVLIGRIRAWFVDRFNANEHVPYAKRVAAGENLGDMVAELPIAPMVYEASELFQEALELLERVGDARGAMSTIIAMGYLNWAADIHMGSDAARHIEEIRRIVSSMRTFTTESEQAAFEAQMLYGVHVFSRAKVIPDLAISRGELAFEKARSIGDRALEFLSAGGTALAYADVGDTERATAWLDKAAAAAIESPTPLRARRLESWRGLAHARAGDPEQAMRHLERACELATEQGHPASRCEALADLAITGARMGAERNDEALLTAAEAAARQAAELFPDLPGHPWWGAQANAALGRIALALGDSDAALEHARRAVAALLEARQEDLHPDVVLAIATVMDATDAPEWAEAWRDWLQLQLAMIAQRTVDEDVRVRWFRGPIGRELSALAGGLDLSGRDDRAPAMELEEADAELLRCLIQGRTNAEIAEDLGLDETTVARRLGELFARIGTSSRAEATAFAFRERVV